MIYHIPSPILLRTPNNGFFFLFFFLQEILTEKKEGGNEKKKTIKATLMTRHQHVLPCKRDSVITILALLRKP